MKSSPLEYEVDRLLGCDNHHKWIGRQMFMRGRCPTCNGIVTSAGSLPENRNELINCRICNQLDYPGTYCESSKKPMEEKMLCFSCLFWQEYADQRVANNPKCFVIDKHHYYVADESGPLDWRGFAGSQFIIEPFDGREIIITTNLWHQGEVPKHFLHVLTDNARFAR